jgi:hypothetical protein
MQLNSGVGDRRLAQGRSPEVTGKARLREAQCNNNYQVITPRYLHWYLMGFNLQA